MATITNQFRFKQHSKRNGQSSVHKIAQGFRATYGKHSNCMDFICNTGNSDIHKAANMQHDIAGWKYMASCSALKKNPVFYLHETKACANEADLIY